MSQLPITSPTGVLAILSGICAFFFWLEKSTQWKFFQFIPPLIFIYLVPMTLSNGGVLPTESSVYGAMKTFLLPMLIVLLLVNMNVRGAVRILGRGLGVMLFGMLGVMIGAPIGLLIVKQWLGPDAWKAFGALSASWVGGSENLAAVSDMVHASGTEFGLAMLADATITYAIWLPVLITSKKFADRFARFSDVAPDHLARMEEAGNAHHETPTAPTSRDYIFLFGARIIATWFADSSARWIEQQGRIWLPPPAAEAAADAAPKQTPPTTATFDQPAAPTVEPNPFFDATTWRILLITTIGIGLSFSPLSRVPGSQELAMTLLYLYVARMGASAELKGVAGQAVPFVIGALICIFIHGSFCLIERVTITMQSTDWLLSS